MNKLCLVAVFLPMLASAQIEPKQAGWSISKMLQVLPPGAKVELSEQFWLPQRMANVYLKSGSQTDKSVFVVLPLSLREAEPGKHYPFTVVFTAPAQTIGESMFTSTVQVAGTDPVSKQEIAFSNLLPLGLKVDPSAKVDFTPLIAWLEAPDFAKHLDDVDKYFSPNRNQRNREIFPKFDEADRKHLANGLKQARLILGRQGFQAYKMLGKKPMAARLKLRFS